MADEDIDLSKDNADFDKLPVATATAVPVPSGMEASFSTSNLMTIQSLTVLRQQGFPLGLAQELGNTKATYPVRFWVVDNSGSMQAPDGNELRGTKDNIIVVPCTRWKELQGAIEYHAELGGLIGATTIFRMLNDPGVNVGPQEFSVGDANSLQTVDQDVAQAVSIIRRALPAGVTPLTHHLNAIGERVAAIEQTLRSQGQKAVVVIATDGLPSDETGRCDDHVKNQFVDALKRLQRLPVWIVIRLCTNDDSVVEYYNDLDKVLELPLECIDDFLGEGKEIAAANRWLNYALPLHRCREMGYQHRIFDLLDERLLNKDELLEFLTLLFGEAAFRNAPDIQADWKGFSAVLEQVLRTESKQWNAATGKLGPWIDMKELNKIYGEKRGFLGFGRKKR